MSEPWKFNEKSSIKEINEERIKVRGQINTLIQEFRSKMPKGACLHVSCDLQPMSIGQQCPNYFIDLEVRI